VVELGFLMGSVLPDEKHVDVAVREVHEKTGLLLICDDLTLLSSNPVRVSLHEAKNQLVYGFSAHVPFLFISPNISTPSKLIQVLTTQSTNNHDGTYVITAKIDIDGLSLAPTQIGRVANVIRKLELL
jgi:hypothetical protein